MGREVNTIQPLLIVLVVKKGEMLKETEKTKLHIFCKLTL